jgi:shikimate dehydrogenase
MSNHAIGGKTTVVGLIGWPVSHSISPAMHNAAFAACGLDWCYVPLPVAPEPESRVGEAVYGLRALGLRGANVTVPHKQAVMPYVDRLAPAAAAIGAVNTLVVEPDGTITGDNTDAAGFVADLRDHDVALDGIEATILGAGGSARAVVFGLAQAGVRRILIANRTVARARELLSALQPQCEGCTLEVVETGRDMARAAAASALVVNCTSLGMVPNVGTMPWPEALAFGPDQIVYDLVYNPQTTRLLEHATRCRARGISGLGMLVWQGAIAFERWTGVEPPVEVMVEAVAGRFSMPRP